MKDKIRRIITRPGYINAAGLALALGLAFGVTLLIPPQAPAAVSAQTAPTATPTPSLVHAQTGCTLVANDLELLRAMYTTRGMTFPTTPDRMRANFFDGDGNAVTHSWEIASVGYFPISGSGAGEQGFQDYLRGFNNALRDIRGHLISMVQPEGFTLAFPMDYPTNKHLWTHADWYLIDSGAQVNYDRAPSVRRGFGHTCYHLDTNPQPHEIHTPTPTSTPVQ